MVENSPGVRAASELTGRGNSQNLFPLTRGAYFPEAAIVKEPNLLIGPDFHPRLGNPASRQRDGPGKKLECAVKFGEGMDD